MVFKGLGILLDNTAMLDIIRVGRNLTIRQIAKTQGVSITWLHGLYNDLEIHFGYITSGMMAADIFTKIFTNKVLWDSLCRQCCVLDKPPSPLGWEDSDDIMALHAIATGMADGTGAAGARPLMPPGCEGYENKYGWQV